MVTKCSAAILASLLDDWDCVPSNALESLGLPFGDIKQPNTVYKDKNIPLGSDVLRLP